MSSMRVGPMAVRLVESMRLGTMAVRVGLAHGAIGWPARRLPDRAMRGMTSVPPARFESRDPRHEKRSASDRPSQTIRTCIFADACAHLHAVFRAEPGQVSLESEISDRTSCLFGHALTPI